MHNSRLNINIKQVLISASLLVAIFLPSGSNIFASTSFAGPMPTCSIVSDTTTTIVGGGNAVLAWDSNPQWTARITGSSWISDLYKVLNPLATSTRTFKKEFSLDLIPSSAKLIIASDNSHKVMINGVQAAGNGDVFVLATEFDVTSLLKAGNNTITFEVTNFGLVDSTPEANPTGLLYKIEIAGSNCGPFISPVVNTPPVITLLGSNPITLTAGTTFTDPGATATDAQDGNITNKIVKTGSVNTSVVGTYTITYTVTDLGGLTDTKTRTINITPVINTYCPQGGDMSHDKFVEAQTAGLISFNLSATSTPSSATLRVLNQTGCTFPLSLSSYKVFNNVSLSSQQLIDSINVTATSSTILKVNLATCMSQVDYWYGPAPLFFNPTDPFFSPSPFIITGFLVNTSQSPIVFGGWGNLPPGGYCQVPVNTPPTITLVGSNPLNLYVGTLFTDPGATATDSQDGNITNKIVKTGSVNTSVVGTYTITYTVTDLGGLIDTKTRTVVVMNRDLSCKITSSSQNGWYGTYFNNSSTTPGMELPSSQWLTSYGDPYSLKSPWTATWYDSEFERFSRIDSSLVFGSNFFPFDSISEEVINGHDYHFGAYWAANVTATTTGVYGFTITSDDDSWVYINGQLVADNSNAHSAKTIIATSTLVSGTNKVEVFFAERHTTESAMSFAFDNSSLVIRPLALPCVCTCKPVNTPPVITLTGQNPYTLVRGSSFIDQWATATDMEDGNITSSITSSGTVNTSVVGTYTITYSVTDSGGLSAVPVSRVVNVVENTQCLLASASIINTIITSGTDTQIIGEGNAVLAWSENPAWTANIPGASWIWRTFKVTDPTKVETVTFKKDFTLTGPVVYGVLNIAADDLYIVKVNGIVVGSETRVGYNFSSTTQKVHDVTSALKTGANTIEIEVTNVIFAGATTPEINPAGLLFKLSIQSGSCSNIPVNTPPVITLIGLNPAITTVGVPFIDPGATATDLEDGDLTSRIVASSSVNINVSGTYNVLYSVKDNEGLEATTTRVVNVIPVVVPPGNKGKINFCMVFADKNNVIATTSIGLPTGLFSIKLATSTSFASSTISSWNATSFAPNQKIILGQNDAECITIANLDFGTYHYSSTTQTSTRWNASKYNDQDTQPVNNAFDFFNYASNGNADGTLSLDSNRSERTVVMYSTFNDLPPPSKAPSCSLYSDTATTIVGGGNAVLAWTGNPAWTANIPGASWIWKTFKVVNPLASTTVTFKKEFSVEILPTSAVLTIASDNIQKVTVNGIVIGQSGLFDQTTIFDITSALKTGENTIIFEVTNLPLTGSTPEQNPAGLLYKIDLFDAPCVTPNPHVNTPPTITLLGNNPLNVIIGNIFSDPGATATDLEDGNLTAQIATTTNVNMSVLGTYTTTYSVTDSGGLSTSTTRTVVVGPVICTINCGGGSTPNANLAVTKTTDKTSANVGDTVTYTISIINNGPNNATGVKVTDTLPSGLTFVSATSTSGSFATTTNIWTIGNLNNASSTTLTIVATIKAGTEGQKITNTAVGTSDVADSNPTNNTTSVDVNVNTPPAPACTSNCGGGGGGGGGGNGPIVQNSLTIFNEQVVETVPGIALVTWNTNLPATRRVIYGNTSQAILGTNPLYGYATTTEYISLPLLTAHGMVVSLLPGQTYYFRPISSDATKTVVGKEVSITRGTVTTSSCYYLYDYLRRDFQNNPVEVKKLQVFLNSFEGESLAVNGIYDIATENGVDRFQNKYIGDVLTPWGHTAPTGYTYILTKKKVNEIYCRTAFPVNALQQAEIDAHKALLEGLKNAGITLPKNNPVDTTPATPLENNVVGQNEPGSANTQTTLAGISTTTRNIASDMVANVISSGKKIGNLAFAFVAWPFGLIKDVTNSCTLGGSWFSWILIIVIIIISVLWYREYRNNRKIEVINKEIDLEK